MTFREKMLYSVGISIAIISIGVITLGATGAYDNLFIEQEKTNVPVESLELEWNIDFYENSNLENSIRAEYGSQGANWNTYYPTWGEVVLNQTQSRGHFAEHNGQEIFKITYWQLDSSARNHDGKNWYIIGEDWNDGSGSKNIYGLNPTTDCVNHPAICFDTNTQPVILQIEELDSNIRIVEEDIVLTNLFAYSVERIGNKILIAVHSDKLMPEYWDDIPIMPQTTMFITFDFVQQVPCFWESNPKVCELELRVAELEEQN